MKKNTGVENTGKNNSGKFKIGYIPWNLGKKGYKINYPKSRRLKVFLKTNHIENIKINVKRGQDHPSWKGDSVGYAALHEWIANKLGKNNKCDSCSSSNEKKYEWANKSGKYLRDFDDWIRLCTKCHRKYDLDKAEELKEKADELLGQAEKL